MALHNSPFMAALHTFFLCYGTTLATQFSPFFDFKRQWYCIDHGRHPCLFLAYTNNKWFHSLFPIFHNIYSLWCLINCSIWVLFLLGKYPVYLTLIHDKFQPQALLSQLIPGQISYMMKFRIFLSTSAIYHTHFLNTLIHPVVTQNSNLVQPKISNKLSILGYFLFLRINTLITMHTLNHIHHKKMANFSVLYST